MILTPLEAVVGIAMNAVRSAGEEEIENIAESAHGTARGVAEETGHRSRSWTTSQYSTRSTMAG